MLRVITYDITDDRRRDRVASELLNYGMRVQKSVFECYLDEEEFRKLKENLEIMIDITSDHIRYYHLCRKDYPGIRVDGVQIVYRDEDYFMI